MEKSRNRFRLERCWIGTMETSFVSTRSKEKWIFFFFFPRKRLIRPLLLSRAHARDFYITPLSRCSEAHETFPPKKCCVLILCSRSLAKHYADVRFLFHLLLKVT